MVACSPTLPWKRMPGSMPKVMPRGAQPLRQLMPAVPLQHHAEVRHRNVLAIHGVVEGLVRVAGNVQMCHQLVAEEIEVHPFGRAASLGTAQQLAVEAARGGEIGDGDGEVEGLQRHAGLRKVRLTLCNPPAGVMRRAWQPGTRNFHRAAPSRAATARAGASRSGARSVRPAAPPRVPRAAAGAAHIPDAGSRTER